MKYEYIYTKKKNITRRASVISLYCGDWRVGLYCMFNAYFSLRALGKLIFYYIGFADSWLSFYNGYAWCIPSVLYQICSIIFV
jgi:hypothetical protein